MPLERWIVYRVLPAASLAAAAAVGLWLLLAAESPASPRSGAGFAAPAPPDSLLKPNKATSPRSRLRAREAVGGVATPEAEAANPSFDKLAALLDDGMAKGDFAPFLAYLEPFAGMEIGFEGDSRATDEDAWAGYLAEDRRAMLLAFVRAGNLADAAVLVSNLGLSEEVVSALFETGMSFTEIEPIAFSNAEPSPREPVKYSREALEARGLDLWCEFFSALREKQAPDVPDPAIVRARFLGLLSDYPGRACLVFDLASLESLGLDARDPAIAAEGAAQIEHLAQLIGRGEVSPFASIQTAIAWQKFLGMEAEGRRLVAELVQVALRRAGESFGSEGTSADDLKQLLEGAVAVKGLLDPEEYRTALDGMRLSFEERGERDAERLVLERIGDSYAEVDRLSDLIACYDRMLALDAASGTNDNALLVKARNACFDAGERERGIEFQRKAIALFAEQKDGSALKVLGQDCVRCNEAELALECLERCRAVYREVGDRDGEGNVLIDTGNAYIKAGDIEKTIALYEEGLAIVRETGNRAAEGVAVNNLGTAYALEGEHEAAIRHYEEALAIYEQSNYASGRADTISNLGDSYAQLGDSSRAIEFYERALNLYRGLGDRSHQAQVLQALVETHEKRGGEAKAQVLRAQAAAVRPKYLWMR